MLFVLFMIFNQTVHWTLYNVADGESQALGGLLYLLAEVDAYVAYYVYRQPRAPVGHCVALEKQLEALL